MTQAVLHTNRGDISLNLFDNQAPKTVANFVGLADGSGEWVDPKTGQSGQGPLYNGVVFHRVIGGFMIQGGCPLGTGTGGPGQARRQNFVCGEWPAWRPKKEPVPLPHPFQTKNIRVKCKIRGRKTELPAQTAGPPRIQRIRRTSCAALLAIPGTVRPCPWL